jgi:hypothetical protein
LNGPSDAATLQILERAIATDPNDMTIREAILIHHLRRGDRKEAEAALLDLKRIAPYSPVARSLLQVRPDP